MNYSDLRKMLRHPQRTYRRFRAWEFKRRGKCIVKIDFPRMKITGRSYENQMGDPKFPAYYAFFGIPYAVSPEGPLRFMPPQPLPQTIKRTELQAYKTHHACIQTVKFQNKIVGSEDCLYLNIYLLKRPIEVLRKRPVLVYIHGGGFHHGSGDIADIRPDAIIRQDIVFVAINYRLNAFGFLNMGIPECSGNAGLKDQCAALRWIKANIDRFGGDPTNVTITGHSAGATCVNLHMISPMSRGLFHKAIVKAGGLNCPWGYQGDDQRPKRLFQKLFKLDNEARNVLVTYLRTGTPNAILEITHDLAQGILQLEPRRLLVFCGPTRENFTSDAFLPVDVETLKQTANPVPLMAGICSQEGGMYILSSACSVVKKRKLKNVTEMVTKDDEFISFLKENFRWSDESARRHLYKIRKWYFPNLEMMDAVDIEENFASLNTDIWFRRFYDNFKFGPRGEFPKKFYVYEFGYLPMISTVRISYSGDRMFQMRAPIHGDDETYIYNPLFLKHLCDERLSSPIKHLIDHMCSMWGNFCRTGTPKSNCEKNLVWKAHTDKKPYHLYICDRSTLERARLFEKRWSRLNCLVDQEPVVKVPIDYVVESVFSFLVSSFDSSATEEHDRSSRRSIESEYSTASSTEDAAPAQ